MVAKDTSNEVFSPSLSSNDKLPKLVVKPAVSIFWCTKLTVCDDNPIYSVADVPCTLTVSVALIFAISL